MKIKITQNKEISRNNHSLNKSYSEKIPLVKKEVLAIGVTSAKKEEILEYIMNSIKNPSKNYYISTPNPEMVVYAADHPEFTAILNASELALCDGVGLFWGAKVLGSPLKERFTGVELVEKLCAKAGRQAITIGFFGGRPGVAEKAAECLAQKYSNLHIVYISDGTKEGYPVVQQEKIPSWTSNAESSLQEGQSITTRHTKDIFPKVDILFVALGFPKQERWMAEHLNKIPVRVMVGVGGALDYISGKVPRAPFWVQNVGLEWLFRLLVQPWRLKRQLALPIFVWMVVKERLWGKNTR